MQDFHPDCTINLLVQSQGKPGKYAWVCSLVTRDSVRLLSARRFLGIVNREEAEWACALFGLEQAARLQQEKVQLCADFSLLLDPAAGGKHRDPSIQSKKAEAGALWASFRLRKLGKISAEEDGFLRQEAMKAFSRKSKDD